MKNIALVFGGRSAEHEVSIISAMQILKGYTKEEINLFPLFLSRNNDMFLAKKDVAAKDFITPEKNHKLKKVNLTFGSNELKSAKGSKKTLVKLDGAILVTHGGLGEDGGLVSLFENSNIPVSSGNSMAQAISYDKVLTKSVCKSLNIKTIPGLWFYLKDWSENPTQVLAQIRKLKLPVIVKPARQGSSIGVTVCHNIKEVVSAINVSLEFDSKFIVEQALTKFKEFNCSALGAADGEILVSSIDEPKKVHEILSFEDKYIGSNKNKLTKSSTKLGSMEGMERSFLKNSKLEAKIKEITASVMREFNLYGVIRVDYLYDEVHKKLYLNEINTVPGSLAFYFWEREGISINELVEKLVEIAESELKNKTKLNLDYITHILQN